MQDLLVAINKEYARIYVIKIEMINSAANTGQSSLMPTILFFLCTIMY